MILSLPSLSTIRVRSGLSRRAVEDITTAAGRAITIDRQRELENGPVRAEPWFDEAADLSRIMLLPGILPLMCEDGSLSGNLTQFDLGNPVADDVALLLRGVRMPLRMACHIAVRFGLSDPIQLEQLPHHVQIWSVLERGERGAGVGDCPWCLQPGHLDHLPTCLPDNLWRARSTAPYNATAMPKPKRAGLRGGGKLAHGLKARRKAKNMLQHDLADAIGMHPNYLARIERLHNNLTEAHAITVARLLGCLPADLFAVPDTSVDTLA